MRSGATDVLQWKPLNLSHSAFRQEEEAGVGYFEFWRRDNLSFPNALIKPHYNL